MSTYFTPIIPPLLRLPTELHLDIISFVLDDTQYPSILSLRHTNRYFHSIIAPPNLTLLKRLERTAFLHALRYYACRHCLRLRHKSHFVSHWVRPSTVPAHTLQRHSVTETWSRPGFYETGSYAGWREDMCADCGFSTGEGVRYALGTRFEVDRKYWVWCVHCKEVKKGLDAGMGTCQTSCKACYKEKKRLRKK